MSREALAPGFGDVDETATREALAPGAADLDETVAAGQPTVRRFGQVTRGINTTARPGARTS